jgi:hypothetical protein
VGRQYILPVVDFGEEVVVGYRPLEIRRLVRELEDGEPSGGEGDRDEGA